MSTLSISNSDVKVYNSALALLGVRGVTSFLDNTNAGRTGSQLYADTLEAALSSYPWRFARDFLSMARSTATPPPPWTGVYDAPTGALVVHTAWQDDKQIEFDVFGQKVAVMADASTTSTFYVQATTMVGPSQWPGYFRSAFECQLASVVAIPLTHDEKMAAFYENKAANLFAKAESRDAQGRTPKRLDTKAFIRARRGGRL